MNHQEIRTNDRHIGGEQTCRGYCCLSASCLLLSSGFEETESFRDSRSPLYVENPPLCQRSTVTLPLHDDSVYFRTRPREMYVPAKLLSRHRTRARSRCRFRVGKYLPSYSLLTIISRYRMCKIYCLLIDPDLTRFLSLSLLLFVKNKRRCLSAN